MLIVFDRNTLDIVAMDPYSSQLTQEIFVQLENIYGSVGQFDHLHFEEDFDFLHDNDRVTGFHLEMENEQLKLVYHRKITVEGDKISITADGIDTATITATVDDPASSETIQLLFDGKIVDEAQAVNGQAQFKVTMSDPGLLELTVKSTTRYGERNITIEGV